MRPGKPELAAASGQPAAAQNSYRPVSSDLFIRVFPGVVDLLVLNWEDKRFTYITLSKRQAKRLLKILQEWVKEVE